MRYLAVSAVLAAFIATTATADNNEIMVNQSGNNNAIGSEAHPATQLGANNDMKFSQRGNSNAIGVSPFPNALQGALQEGKRHYMEVRQPGNRNAAVRLHQDGGDRNEMHIRQTGNKNRVSLLRQHGDRNKAGVGQRGNRNDGFARQVGDRNVLIALQTGNRNSFRIISGDFGVNDRPGSCTSCDVNLLQSGNANHAGLSQQDTNQMTNVLQSGNRNAVHTMQGGN